MIFASEYIGGDSHVPFNIVFQKLLKQGFDIVALDSWIVVQSLIGDELNLVGRSAETWVLDCMKAQNKGNNDRNLLTSFLAIQQVGKAGDFVGSNYLKHMLHQMLHLKWDLVEKGKRYMIFSKNRKGMEQVKLYYSLVPNGIVFDVERHQMELELRTSLAVSAEEPAQMKKDEFLKKLREAQMAKQIEDLS